jgi:CzcA family heavy metal efflux pump
MLNAFIRTALQFRSIVIGLALAVLVGGSIVATSLPIDVLPDLTRPRVTLVTECPGLAPEEVESLVTLPLESAVTGASGVMAVRSSSDIGLSVMYVEFDWSADIYTARQIVQERISVVADQLPDGVRPQMGPIASLLGQIMLIGMWSEEDSASPLDVRTYADWVIRKRLLTIPGISQVITMGGGRKQYQVLVDQHKMHKYDVGLVEIEEALAASNINVSGGYLDENNREFLIRGIGRLKSAEDIRKVVIKLGERPVLLGQVALVQEGAQFKRGDSSVNGRPAVVLTVQKQPDADTRKVTEEIHKALKELREAIPAGITLHATYEQREFIDHSVANVIEALRDGAILVVIVLFLFLLNLRTTFITLTAIPISVAITALVFHWFGLSINVMTLGGLAVALGELVDDAIVDVENIFRRLRDNAANDNPQPILRVIFNASLEVRYAIIISTVLVIIVFAPLFALTGLAGRLFTPLGIAYIVSILASTLVSLTVTPVLCFYLLPRAKATFRGDGFVLRLLKLVATPVIRMSMTTNGLSVILSVVAIGVVVSVWAAVDLGRDFLPPFDEGAAQINLSAAPGTSLSTSRTISQLADQELAKLVVTEENPTAPLIWFTCRTGRAEQDEHVMGVNISEYVLTLNPDSELSREELIEELHHSLEGITSVDIEVEQPIAHLISHMLSGVQAQIAIKLFGDDLDTLRREAREIKDAIVDIDGIAPPVVEQQQVTPQYRLEVRRDRLAELGVSAGFVYNFIETAMNGRVVTQVIEGERQFDLLLRLAEPYRTNMTQLGRMPMELPDGRRLPLSALVNVIPSAGPTAIARDNGRRRIVVRVNTLGRDVGSVVAEILQRVESRVQLPDGYFIAYGGQFEAQQSASRRILLLSLVALAVVFSVLYSTYRSVGIVLQLLIAMPIAFIGGVLGMTLTGQTLSIAAMVGFVSLGGIAARNGLLLISTYLGLVAEHGFSRETILRGSLERLAPVLMTALTTGLALVPLVIGGHLPGKEILYPVATVILGGLITSTLCEFFVRPGLFFAFSAGMTERPADPSMDMVPVEQTVSAASN